MAMRRRPLAALGLAALCACLLGAAGASYVTVRGMNVRVLSKPKLISPPVASVERGEQLELQSEQKPWVKVRTPGGAVGWVHGQYLQDGKVALSTRPGSASSSASSQEIELAGRGFTKEAEESYRGKHDVKFDDVDRIEKLSPDLGKVAAFAAEGKLAGGAP